MRPLRPTLLVAAALLAIGLTACASPRATSGSADGTTGTPLPTPTAAAQPVTTSDGVRVVPDIPYGRADGQRLLLDACLPKSAAASTTDAKPSPQAAIVMIHGGSWTRGDKADAGYRDVCEFFAKNGYPTFNIDYRMDPKYVFPAALDDARTAVAWLRADAQLGRFDLDATRIGAFGGSAGGNVAALLGTAGTGPLTGGTRVAAVAELSGPADLTGADATPDFVPVQLAFLGCSTEAACPNARAASPIFQVSADDPPFFIANSTHEKIPIEQSQRFADTLRAAGVFTTFVRVDGGLHSIAMLSPSLRDGILSFYASTLGVNSAEDSADNDDADAGATG